MRDNIKIVGLSLIILLLANGVFAQKRRIRPAPRREIVEVDSKSAVDSSLEGELKDGVYQNKFFGLKIVIPENWLLQERQVSEAIKDFGTKAVKGKTSVTEKAYQQAVQRLTVLFTASRDIIGIENNSTMIFAAEKSTPLMQVRNGKDYLRFNIQSFKKLQLPPDFKYSETVESEKFGTETFYSLDVQRATFKQRYYAIYRKGYSLFFTFTYVNEEDLEAMKAALRESDFSWKD